MLRRPSHLSSSTSAWAGQLVATLLTDSLLTDSWVCCMRVGVRARVGVGVLCSGLGMRACVGAWWHSRYGCARACVGV
jgi:hypothetical protein